MYRHTGALTDGHESGNDIIGIPVLEGDHLPVGVRGNAAHVVVDGGQHRNGFLCDIHAGENLRGFGNSRKTLLYDIGSEMFEVQEDMVLLGTNSTAFAHFQRHGAADHIAAGKIFGVRCVTFHEPLTFGVRQIPAFPARTLRDQATGTIDPGRVKLHELHILQGKAGGQRHAVSIAGAGVGGGAGEIGTPIATGGEHGHMRAKTVNGAVFQAPGDHTAASAFFIHDQVEREVLDKKLGLVLEALLIKGVQNRMPGAIGGGAGALGTAFTEMRRHATEGTLINFPFLGAREGHAEVLELDDRVGCLAAHVLDGILIAEPV